MSLPRPLTRSLTRSLARPLVATMGGGGGVPPEPVPSDETLTEIVYQSTHVNDPKPNGNPHLWADGGTVGLNHDNSEFPYMVPWAVIALAEGQSLDEDVLVKIDALRLVVLTDGWETHEYPARIAGRYIVEDFADEEDAPAPPWSLAPDPLIVELIPGYVFHGYPGTERVDTTGQTINGLIVAYRAKLVSKTGADISGAVGQYLAITGLDGWLSADNPFELPHGASNADYFISSANVIETSYRWFYGSTLDLEALQANRPPAWLEQLTQTDPQTLDPDIVKPIMDNDFVISDNTFVIIGQGHETGMSYVDLQLVGSSGGLSFPDYGALSASIGDTVEVNCYASLMSGEAGFTQLEVAMISEDYSWLGSAGEARSIDAGPLIDALKTVTKVVMEADTAMVHGSWYIEGTPGSVFRFHFQVPTVT